MSNQTRLQVCYYSVKQDLTKISINPGNCMLFWSGLYYRHYQKSAGENSDRK